jgi:hypothetical protein
MSRNSYFEFSLILLTQDTNSDGVFASDEIRLIAVTLKIIVADLNQSLLSMDFE